MLWGRAGALLNHLGQGQGEGIQDKFAVEKHKLLKYSLL